MDSNGLLPSSHEPLTEICLPSGTFLLDFWPSGMGVGRGANNPTL
jgi:hypothetical protein